MEKNDQMTLISETNEVIQFLRRMEDEKLMAPSAVQVRLTACQTLFSVLKEGETGSRYILANLTDIVSRFQKKEPKFKKASLRVYKSRVKASLQDYQDWVYNPKVWEKKKRTELLNPKEELENVPEAPAPIPKILKTKKPKSVLPITDDNTLHFPLARNRRISITLPNDGLSSDELLQLCLSLYPYCGRHSQSLN